MVVGSIGDRHRNGRSDIAGQVGRPLVFVGKLFLALRTDGAGALTPERTHRKSLVL